MLSVNQLRRIKVKMVNDEINQSKLARIIYCSNSTLSQIFTRKKDFPNIEKRLISWLNGTNFVNKGNKEIRDYNEAQNSNL